MVFLCQQQLRALPSPAPPPRRHPPEGSLQIPAPPWEAVPAAQGAAWQLLLGTPAPRAVTLRPKDPVGMGFTAQLAPSLLPGEQPLNLDGLIHLMFSESQKSVSFDCGEGNVLSIRFSLPSHLCFGFWLLRVRTSGDSLLRTGGVRNVVRASCLCSLGASVSSDITIIDSFPKISHFCSIETLGVTEFCWDIKKPQLNPFSVFHTKNP